MATLKHPGRVQRERQQWLSTDGDPLFFPYMKKVVEASSLVDGDIVSTDLVASKCLVTNISAVLTSGTGTEFSFTTHDGEVTGAMTVAEKYATYLCEVMQSAPGSGLARKVERMNSYFESTSQNATMYMVWETSDTLIGTDYLVIIEYMVIG